MSVSSPPDDPFAPREPDESAELEALVRSIRRAHGFSLLLACCNQVDQRARLMDRITVNNPDLRIQKISIYEPINHLLDYLRSHLDQPAPDAAFVYGLETWLSPGKTAEESPFILNLNAARNFFPQAVPCSLVLWVPEHLLASIVHGAPDFCSIRSGLFMFAPDRETRSHLLAEVAGSTWAELAGLPIAEKHERLRWLRGLLREYETTPEESRDRLVEARLLDRIATLSGILGNRYDAAEFTRRALAIYQEVLGEDSAEFADELNNLGRILYGGGDLEAAEPLIRQAFEIATAFQAADNPQLIRTGINLAYLLNDEGESAEAESLLRRLWSSLDAQNDSKSQYAGLTLHALASVLAHQHRFKEAVDAYQRALEIKKQAFGSAHPETGATLNNLALLLMQEGRMAEAEAMLRDALRITEAAMGLENGNRLIALRNLRQLLQRSGREAEAERLQPGFHSCG